MHIKQYPVIDPVATGKNIARLRTERGLSVKELQAFFGFEEPQAIYRWQWGKSLPSVDNLYALSILFEVPMDEIIVPKGKSIATSEPQDKTCGSVFCRLFGTRQRLGNSLGLFASKSCAGTLFSGIEKYLITIH